MLAEAAVSTAARTYAVCLWMYSSVDLLASVTEKIQNIYAYALAWPTTVRLMNQLSPCYTVI